MTTKTYSPRDIALFLGVSFGGSWGLAAAVRALSGPLTPLTTVLVGVPYMLCPALGALWVTWRRGESLKETLALRFNFNRWWAVAWGLPALLVLLCVLVSAAWPGLSLRAPAEGILARLPAGFDPKRLASVREGLALIPPPALLALLLVQALGAGALVNTWAALGEELGWRGVLQNMVQPLGFWKGAWLTGALWGPWHAALIIQGYNYPQHPWLGLVFMTAMTVLLAPLLSFVRLKSGSVIAAALCHGVFNGCAGLATLCVGGGDDLVVGMTGGTGLTALLLVNLVLWGSGATRGLVTPSLAATD